MAPIRRYLRISKYSVLECRIFLSDPADEAWLGSRFEAPPGTDDDQRSVAARVSAPRTMLQRIFETIRPLVVSKLQEESVRRYGPGNAKKKAAPVKDVLVDGQQQWEYSVPFHPSSGPLFCDIPLCLALILIELDI